MGEFIARYLGVPFAYARHLQKTYYRQFGTTLNGLMRVHKMDPRPSSTTCTIIDLSVMAEHPELAAAIERLPGRKLILTNGSRAHAERVAGKLGVLHLFEGIFDIVASDYVPKPQPACYDVFLKAHGVDARHGRDVRGHAAQPGSAARARHDDCAGAVETPTTTTRCRRRSAAGSSRPSTCII